ncbi:transposable element Tcb2 transposase [Trichonephila clavipes]|nr:transposable element Tcb2 transposase [Trichonephila clavipes]
MLGSRTDLHIFDAGSVNGTRYCNEIFLLYVRLFICAMGLQLLFIDVWDQLKRQMPTCHYVHDLEVAVQDLWAHLPQDNIRCLINSMPDRVVACITAGGGPTLY